MKQGEIWEIDLNPTIGAEIKKRRPAIIVSDDAIGILPLKVIVPVTAWKERFRGALWMTRLQPDTQNGLQKESVADAFQIRSISTKRFLRKTGSVSSEVLDAVKTAVKAVIDAE